MSKRFILASGPRAVTLPRLFGRLGSEANAWISLPGSASAHAAPAIGVINGKLYVAGGLNGSGELTNVLEVYDPAANSWTNWRP